MVIDHQTLIQFGGLPPEPPSPRPVWVAPLVFVIGASCLGGMTFVAWGDVGRSRMVCLIIAVATLVMGAIWYRPSSGWILSRGSPWAQELGEIAAGEEDRDGLQRALGALFWLAVIAVGSMRLKCPGLIP